MHEQNLAIVKSLVTVAWADGVYAEAEQEMLEALLSAFEASDEEAASVRAYAADKKSLEDIPLTELSTDDRRLLLQHAVLLSYIDGEQTEVERAFIGALCTKLRIPEDESKALIESAEGRAKRFLNLL